MNTIKEILFLMFGFFAAVGIIILWALAVTLPFAFIALSIKIIFNL